MTTTPFSPVRSWLSGWKMTDRHAAVLFLLLSSVITFSCRSGKNEVLAGPYGKTGEVLVVMPRENWNGAEGELIRNLFSLPYEMLPQYEPVFDIAAVIPSGFRDFLLLHRSIIIVQTTPGIRDTSVNIQYDVRSRSQVVITLRAPGASALESLLNAEGQQIIATLEDMEIKRLTDAFSNHENNDVISAIRKKHGISLVIPDDYSIATDSAGFTWIIKESGAVIQGILIYGGNADGLSLISDDMLMAARDSVLKRFVPGQTPGSYMTTEKEFPPVIERYRPGDKTEITEMRGLWKTQSGISMGGPFMSLSFMMPGNKYCTVEGFVFAAGLDKRDYMREVRAIVTSVKINPADNQPGGNQ
jgi:hypothetical protein